MRAALLLAATAEAASNQSFKTVIDLLTGLKNELVTEANEVWTYIDYSHMSARLIVLVTKSCAFSFIYTLHIVYQEQTNWAKLKVWCESAIGESKNEMEEQTLKVEEYTGKVAAQNANIVKYTKERDDNATGEETYNATLFYGCTICVFFGRDHLAASMETQKMSCVLEFTRLE